jgi:hypothetical protein
MGYRRVGTTRAARRLNPGQHVRFIGAGRPQAERAFAVVRRGEWLTVQGRMVADSVHGFVREDRHYVAAAHSSTRLPLLPYW